MSGGRLFQRRLPATGNARSSTVDSRVRRITSCEYDDDRRRRRLESAKCSQPVIIYFEFKKTHCALTANVKEKMLEVKAKHLNSRQKPRLRPGKFVLDLVS